MRVPCVCATVCASCSRAAATAARIDMTLSRACESFLAGYRAIIQQPLAPRQIRLSGAQGRFALIDLRAQLRILRIQPAHLAHSPRQFRFGVAHGDPRVGRIQIHERSAGRHRLRVIDVHREDRARLLAADLHDIAIDVGIIGGLEVARMAEPVERVADKGEQDYQCEQRQAEPASALVPGARRIGRGGRIGGLDWAYSWGNPRSMFLRVEAAAKLQQQIYTRQRQVGHDLHALAARIEHLRLGAEHREIAGKPCAVALSAIR